MNEPERTLNFIIGKVRGLSASKRRLLAEKIGVSDSSILKLASSKRPQNPTFKVYSGLYSELIDSHTTTINPSLDSLPSACGMPGDKDTHPPASSFCSAGVGDSQMKGFDNLGGKGL